MERYFLCNKCGDTVLVTTSTGDPIEMCCNSMPVRTSGICGGAFSIELVPKMDSASVSFPSPLNNEARGEGGMEGGQEASGDYFGDNWVGDAREKLNDREKYKLITMKTGVELIAEERKRQINKEGWASEHDADHAAGELADAAVCYALNDDAKTFINNAWGNDQWLNFWPFDLEWWKPTPNDRIRELQKAGALIAAEIDRLQCIEKVKLKSLIGEKVIFEEDNDIPYLQDHFFPRGIPAKIEFTIDAIDYRNERCRLVAFGYGIIGKAKGGYGNGSISINLVDLPDLKK